MNARPSFLFLLDVDNTLVDNDRIEQDLRDHLKQVFALQACEDTVFQPRKVQRSGLWTAVQGRVLIYIHKEEMLNDVERYYPAEHYVFVDDKLRLLTAVNRFRATV